MATKNYFVGPQDGWVKILTVAAKATVRISAYPHTQPFYVYGAPSGTPTLAANIGVQVCHKPFLIENFNAAGNIDAFWVRTVNPSSQNANGQTRIDVYTDGGTLV